MSGPITWRTVNGPSLAEASRPLAFAQNSIDNAFDGLKDVVKQTEATDAANWNQVKENNTQNFLNRLYSVQGAEGFKALQDSGELDRMLAANGAQIDRAAARSAMDGRLSTLQNRDTQAIAYRNTMDDAAQAPEVRRIQMLTLTDPTAAQAELAANPNLRAAVQLAQGIDSRRQTLTERDRETTRFGFAQTEEERRVAAERQAALLRPFAVQKAQAEVDNIPLERERLRLTTAGARENLLASQAARTQREQEIKNATERQRLATALEGNMYAEGVYTDSKSVDLAKIMKDYSIGGKDEDAGKVRSDITKRLNKMTREGIEVVGPDGKPETLPIPLGAVRAALLASSDSWGPDNFGSSFERELKARLQSVTEKRPNNMLNAPPVMDPFGIMSGSKQPPGAQNKALDDWLAFKNISRSSAEVAPAPRR